MDRVRSYLRGSSKTAWKAVVRTRIGERKGLGDTGSAPYTGAAGPRCSIGTKEGEPLPWAGCQERLLGSWLPRSCLFCKGGLQVDECSHGTWISKLEEAGEIFGWKAKIGVGITLARHGPF